MGWVQPSYELLLASYNSLYESAEGNNLLISCSELVVILRFTCVVETLGFKAIWAWLLHSSLAWEETRIQKILVSA